MRGSLRGTSTLCAPSAAPALLAAQSQEDWYLRYLDLHQRSGSSGDEGEKLWLQDEKLWLQASWGWGEGALATIGLAVLFFIISTNRREGRDAIFRLCTSLFILLSTFHTSLVVASSRAIDRKQSQNINIVLSHVIMYICHRMFTRARHKAYIHT